MFYKRALKNKDEEKKCNKRIILSNLIYTGEKGNGGGVVKNGREKEEEKE